jgi:hypothetical protein
MRMGVERERDVCSCTRPGRRCDSRTLAPTVGADMVMFIWQNHALNACSLKRLSIDLSNELLIVEKDQREPGSSASETSVFFC